LKSAKAKIQLFLAAAIAVLYLFVTKNHATFLTSKSEQQGTNINIGGHQKSKTEIQNKEKLVGG